ncbi:hypothetical protein Bca52824_085991 [Brassica carinata]|uniref:Auxin-responsive protein n=1 Tax=Brassica carinata TaxID=52824 RepID=A0A8X7P8T0_BRACI|nr:hypothetical protein Bca52824_085991 [Brassica carinata]
MEKDGLELEITELRLGLPGRDVTEKMMKKRGFTEMIMTSSGSNSEQCESGVVSSGVDVEKVNETPAVKTQVVGWPPVCSYRRKTAMDLGSNQGYDDLAFALDKLFGFHGIG